MYTNTSKKDKDSTQNPAKAVRRRTRHTTHNTQHTTPIPAQRHGDNGKGKTQFVPQENKCPEAFASGDFGPGHGPYLIGMLVPTGKTRCQAFIIYFRPIRRRKHSIVFSIRQQIVIGPTPPGTGVMTEASGSTAA